MCMRACSVRICIYYPSGDGQAQLSLHQPAVLFPRQKRKELRRRLLRNRTAAAAGITFSASIFSISRQAEA
jgi:hypothetical protein